MRWAAADQAGSWAPRMAPPPAARVDVAGCPVAAGLAPSSSAREPGRGEGEREERPEGWHRRARYRSDFTASTMCEADRPNLSTSSSGRPLRGSSRTAIWCTLPPIGATAFITASPMPPAG